MSAAAALPVALRKAVGALERAQGPLVLAVSGGLDSMTLLHLAAGRRAIRARLTVATFDHGTGEHARRAVRLVRSTARSLGIPFVTARAAQPGANEAQWREGRWRFLNAVARARRAQVVTAHTRDDQVETVFMRLLRGASVRGIAGLYADSPVLHPLLGVRRSSVRRHAIRHRVPFVDDPSNVSLARLRNRVRREILPAIRSLQPHFERGLLSLARRAARLRRQVEGTASRLSQPTGTGSIFVAAKALHGLHQRELALLWPALVAPLGIPLDRRAVVRAADFAVRARPGQQAQLAGGLSLDRTRAGFFARRDAGQPPAATVELGRALRFGAWTFRRVSRAIYRDRAGAKDTWMAAVDANRPLQIRAWRPGDRLRNQSAQLRRVKRYFSELSIPVSERSSWPVLLLDNEIVWVPGVCRASAATVSAARRTTYMVCERRVPVP
ncbi:MAG: tRNA lysidine(34) synthetase TilS [Gemmatimonadaceae bacterium]